MDRKSFKTLKILKIKKKLFSTKLTLQASKINSSTIERNVSSEKRTMTIRVEHYTTKLFAHFFCASVSHLLAFAIPVKFTLMKIKSGLENTPVENYVVDH